MRHPGAIAASRRTQPVDVFPGDLKSLGNVRDFAEADTTLGMVNVGYTNEAQLAFTFAYTNDTYLLPIVDILSELISAIVARRPIWSRPHKPAKLMRHTLGRPLTPGNSGAMQWGDGIAGDEYRALHVAVWTECRRVLKPGGIFVLNVKDHIRGGVLQEVTKWHSVALLMLEFVCTRRVHVPCPGQRHGANGHLRVAYESVLQFTLR